MNEKYTYGFESSAVNESSVIKNIFLWMAAGLALTGFVANGLYTSGLVVQVIRSGMMFPLLIGEIALVFIISRNIMKFKATTGILLFLLYSAINGVTLSSIFLAYTYSSIANTFFITAALFGTMALYGSTTKKDLTKMGTYLFMGLIGVVIATLVNFFIRSSGLNYIISIAGVVLFTGLTAYDVQKFTKISREIGSEGGDMAMKVSIIGALNLYLDFINLFLFLLRFLGRRR
ncbi:Bax inhibitor-1/YccA family protein [Thiospirochaeta perfilievii]|uniref:Bax inhibitor-1/YccA family protein n=1 Tax=Thiospirochaeta perfilievii TaxID=252967 RepID=A0A5C1Q790_9SPIO|nr:Bax inhibitor-1/YccA family protein [Thiospirochaeta perfilievii]QEN03228.1 Bax inhibitor-1/YccA family protein [Thiospirochaeta perfilievii]